MADLVLTQQKFRATIEGDELLGTVEPLEVLLEIGLRGPPGSDGSAEVTATASEDLSGHVAVGFLSDGRVAKATGGVRPQGVTPAAAMSGQPARVVLGGPIDEGSWTWAAGPVYVASNGALTQVPPATGEVHEAGEAAGPTRLIVRPRHVATLAA